LAWKEHLWTAAALAAASLCAWFATPVSHWFTTALLWQIPVEVDVRLGRNASMEQLENECPTAYDPQYTPLIRSIGHELVQIHRGGLPQRRLWNVRAAIRTLKRVALGLCRGSLQVHQRLCAAGREGSIE
jgi:hypothetical protein